MNLSAVTTTRELENFQIGPNILFFWAAWHEPSCKGGPMQQIIEALSQKFKDIKFLLIEAEAVPEISEAFNVSVVPTFVSCIKSKVIERGEGADPGLLSALTKRLAAIPSNASQENDFGTKESKISNITEDKSKELLFNRLQILINSAPVMLFMKGSSSEPRCGFSRQMVEILQKHNIPFASFDILTDEDVRSGLKEYSDWPTYPQLYVKGALVGGLDIVKEMAASGDLKEQLGTSDLVLPPPAPTLEERLKALINQAPVMLFMKGVPDAPRCGFSRQIIEILVEADITFDSFDILSDEEIRAGLKEYSDWPTYPQLYVRGSLVGGLDIVKEMSAGGDLKGQIGV